MRRRMDGNTSTHKNDDPFRILLPLLGPLVVDILCGLGVYGEEQPRALPRIGLFFQWRVRRRRMNATPGGVYYYV
jgi:hypothetical protein